MARSHERRTERATVEEVAEVERQLWEFAKRIDPPSVPEAKLRPGAFLWRVHRTWHSLGRGTGGLASRSFRALRDELLRRDPPVRNLQPKLYGNTALFQAEAEQLIEVMLESWHVERGRSGKWQAGPLAHPEDSKAVASQDLEAIRENLLHTLFKGEDSILLEEPVGVAPEIFMEQRGASSLALIIPTISETTAHLSPSNAYGGFSNSIRRFIDAAYNKSGTDRAWPLLIWVLKLGVIRNNADFHQDFHCLSIYSASLTNWYLRLSRRHGADRNQAKRYWNMIVQNSAFVVYGLPDRTRRTKLTYNNSSKFIDENLADLTPNFFIPHPLPMILSNHRLVRRHVGQDFGLNVSIEAKFNGQDKKDVSLKYWLFPGQPRDDLSDTAETTGLPVFDPEISPGEDYDLAFLSVYEGVLHHLGLATDSRCLKSYCTLRSMGWNILTITEFQKCLLASTKLSAE